MAQVRQQRRGAFSTRIINLFLLLIVGLSGCTKSRTKLFNVSRKKIATVGEYSITEQDIANQIEVNSLMQLPSSEEEALEQLKILRLKEWILADYGFKIGDEELATESRRIDGNTKDPETLAQIKKNFDGDEQGYLNHYVRGILVARTFEPFFHSNSKLHVIARGRADGFLSKVKSSPRRLVALAQENSYPIFDYKYSKDYGFEKIEFGRKLLHDPAVKTPPQLLKRDPVGVGVRLETFLPWIKSEHLTLAENEVYFDIIEDQESYLVFQMIEPRSKTKPIWFRTVSIAKGDFHEWYASEREKRLGR